MIVPREPEEPRMKPNGRALPFEHGTPQVLLDQGASGAMKRLDGLDMSAEKTLERLVKHEERKERPRIPEHHYTQPDSGRTPCPMGTRDGSARAVEGATRFRGRRPYSATRPPGARSAIDPSTCQPAV